MDFTWPGSLIIEQKSAGKHLITAHVQTLVYCDWLLQYDKLDVKEHWVFFAYGG